MFRKIITCALAFAAGLALVFAAAVNAGAATKPHRVATWIGAHSNLGDPATWAAANAAIGPLQTQRVFFTPTLPASYADDPQCSTLPAAAMCVISWQTPDVNVASYVRSIPSSRHVEMVFTHEPEGTANSGAPKFPSGAAFVAAFKTQSAEVRAAAAGRKNIEVAMVAELYEYGAPGMPGYGCSYIPPKSTVDHYFADLYDPTGTLAADDPGLARWMSCTANMGKTRGLAEWGVGPSSCIASGLTREQVMSQDLADFAHLFPSMFLLEYWWVDNSVTSGQPCRNWQFATSEAGPWIAAEKVK
jgi:hypothetical protein